MSSNQNKNLIQVLPPHNWQALECNLDITEIQKPTVDIIPNNLIT
jgi:hypothetical protein